MPAAAHRSAATFSAICWAWRWWRQRRARAGSGRRSAPSVRPSRRPGSNAQPATQHGEREGEERDGAAELDHWSADARAAPVVPTGTGTAPRHRHTSGWFGQHRTPSSTWRSLRSACAPLSGPERWLCTFDVMGDPSRSCPVPAVAAGARPRDRAGQQPSLGGASSARMAPRASPSRAIRSGARRGERLGHRAVVTPVSIRTVRAPTALPACTSVERVADHHRPRRSAPRASRPASRRCGPGLPM